MSIQEDREQLRRAILSLKASFDEVDLRSLTSVDEIVRYLDNIDDVFVQVQQFKSRWDVNDWLSWGHNLWIDIERNRAALERTLSRIERQEAKTLHKFDRKMSFFSLMFVAITTISVAFAAYFSYLSLEKAEVIGGKTQTEQTLAVQVVRVIDGDTIEVCCVFGDREKVRYIGINTPETKHPSKGVEYFGKEAAEANRKLVDGKTVRLEFDVQQVDRYKRLLAYVYLEDGTFVNAWLVENGYAAVMTIPPNVKHQDLFLKLQREAREDGRGLWRTQSR